MARFAESVVLRFPRTTVRPRDLAAFPPSWRTLAVAFGAVLAVSGGYLAARQSALFAVEAIEIDGAPPAVSATVRDALRPLDGESLLRLDLGALESRLAAIPSVRAASFDRAFPHTLRVTVTAERPVAVLRRGPESWLVSARGRVVRRLERPRLSRLPRLWVPATVGVAAGDVLTDREALKAVHALAAVSARRVRVPAVVRQARATDRELTLVLAAGTQLRLANEEDVELKLAVARSVLLALDPNRDGWPAYIDLAVPGRPVVGGSVSQLESES